jgi:hypothetical protein
MTDRDDAALTHFAARSQQAKILTDKVPTTTSTPGAAPININIYESPFGSLLDEVEAARYNYIGVPLYASPYWGQKSKQLGYACAKTSWRE